MASATITMTLMTKKIVTIHCLQASLPLIRVAELNFYDLFVLLRDFAECFKKKFSSPFLFFNYLIKKCDLLCGTLV